VSLDLKLTVAGVQEEPRRHRRVAARRRTSNQIGGSLSRREIEEVPSNSATSPASRSSSRG
jgi:hypothetical protein